MEALLTILPSPFQHLDHGVRGLAVPKLPRVQFSYRPSARSKDPFRTHPVSTQEAPPPESGAGLQLTPWSQ